MSALRPGGSFHRRRSALTTGTFGETFALTRKRRRAARKYDRSLFTL